MAMMGIITAIAIVAPELRPEDFEAVPDADKGVRVDVLEAEEEEEETEEAVGVIVTSGWVE